ncbi:MAG: HEAT repeat domain-containing protein [Kiritimatiellae bacterium]|nr:HEAT repeat domain-containing protein [Kiritimatiellia bacterium]
MKQRIAATVLSIVMSLGLGLEASGEKAKLKAGIFVGSVAVPEIVRTLTEQGMEVATFTAKDVSEGKIHQFDVLFFGGGWNGYDWLDLPGRMQLVEFVQARGGGVIFSMFRCGVAARSSIRPSFPEIAWAYNKVNGPGIIIADTNHPIVKGLPEKFMAPFWDHAVMQLGPEGTIIARDTSDEISIACGKAGKGRVVFIGPWIGIGSDGKAIYPLPPNDAKLLLNSIGWITANASRELGGDNAISADIRLKVLRRERTWDWTHDERGFDSKPGILAAEMFEENALLDDLLYRIKGMLPYASGELAKRASQLAETLAALTNQLNVVYEQKKKDKKEEIGGMGVAELEKTPEWTGTIIPTQEVEACRRETEEFEKIMGPIIAQTKKESAEYERKEDLTKVPGLIEQLGCEDKTSRAAAALELGRIGDRRAISALVAALKDGEYPVRRNAIYALSWMQAKEAVPALLKASEDAKDTLTQRRIVQALGMLGDDKAEDFLIEKLADKDYHTRQNAILSLGWLKSKKAAPQLANRVEVENITREERACVVRALGHIGDENVIPVLQSAAKKFHENLHRTGGIAYYDYIPVQLLCDQATNEIGTGGKSEKGVSQQDFLRKKEHFYWLTGKYNAFLGRFFIYGSLTPIQRCQVIRQAGYAGVTGFMGYTDGILGRVFAKAEPSWEKYSAHLAEVEAYFPLFSAEHQMVLSEWRRNATAICDKASFEYDIMRRGNYECFGGFWSEECLSWAYGAREGKGFLNDGEFRAYLGGKYNRNELAGFGINNIEAVKIPAMNDEGRKEKFLFAEYMEYVADKGVDEYGETAEWLKQMRMGTELLFNLGGRSRAGVGKSTYISGYPRLGSVLGSYGPQSYSEHSFGNNFDLELHLDGEMRPVHGQFYTHQADGNARVERGYASSLLHGQFFFQMNWQFAQKRPWAYMNAWEKGRGEAAERQFQKGKAISDYLVEAESPKEIALLYSGRTSTLSYGTGSPDSIGGGRCLFRYTQNQQGIWEALVQSHLPVDILWLETLTMEKIGRYKVAILSDAKSLSSSEVRLLKDWVGVGGVLISTAGTSLHDQWDISLTNYAFSDVFGVDYAKTEMRNKDEFRSFVERDIKPGQVDKIKLVDDKYMGFAHGEKAAEYEKAMGYDVVKVTQGKSVATWEDGSPAIVENRCGKGLSIFLAPIYPGLSYKSVRWTVDPLYFEYWDGAKELIGATVKRGLEFAQAELPLEVANCPFYVEAALRIQKKRNRAMVHLLNIDSKVNLVRGVDVKLRLGKSIEDIYYPYPTREKVKWTIAGDDVKFKVRDFDVHEMIVVEWKRIE